MTDEPKKRTAEDKAEKMLNEEKAIIDLEPVVKKEKLKKTTTNERRCEECGGKGFQEYEGKFRCKKHHSEIKRKANIEFEKREKLKKIGMIIGAIVGIVIGSVIIYQFVANL